jgi:glycosyltransferase involved in cell wall biosynthesis
MKKIIGIDARLYGPHAKGLGRYVQEIVDRILELDHDNDYVLFMSPQNHDFFVLPNERVKKVLCQARWYTVREQFELPYLVWKHKISLMHIPHFNVPFFCLAPFIVTIHDLILTKYPSQRATTLSPFFYKLKYLGYRLIISRALRRAKRIIAVSEFTKNDISQQFGTASDRISLIYEGVADQLNDKTVADPEVVLARYGVKQPFVMYVGNAYPHKNLEGLLAEFKKLGESDLSLVLVGAHDYFYKRLVQKVKEEGIERVILPGFVPDEDLSAFFASAKAYVFPSLYEGFGLPPLEAMANGCPVLSSDRSCLREVLGEAAIFFDPDQAGWLGRSLEFLSENSQKDKLVELGRIQAAKYSWERAAKETWVEYKRFL